MVRQLGYGFRGVRIVAAPGRVNSIVERVAVRSRLGRLG